MVRKVIYKQTVVKEFFCLCILQQIQQKRFALRHFKGGWSTASLCIFKYVSFSCFFLSGTTDAISLFHLNSPQKITSVEFFKSHSDNALCSLWVRRQTEENTNWDLIVCCWLPLPANAIIPYSMLLSLLFFSLHSKLPWLSSVDHSCLHWRSVFIPLRLNGIVAMWGFLCACVISVVMSHHIHISSGL